MEKSIKAKYFLDITMAFTFLITVIAGIVNLIADEKGAFLALPISVWLGVHVFFGIFTALLVFVHLILHRDWLTFVSKKIFVKDKDLKN